MRHVLGLWGLDERGKAVSRDALISKLAAAIVEELETKKAYYESLRHPLSAQLRRIFFNQWRDAEDRRVELELMIEAEH